MKTYLCLDIGGSKYLVGLIDRDGNILASRKGSWPELTRSAILDTVISEAAAVLNETGAEPSACGITIPGLADPSRGMWVEAQFSGIRDFPICDEVSARLSLPCFCDNDAQAYSLAEMIFGSCKNDRDFIYVNVSNGIGGSVVCNGQLIYGARGTAGEFGHCVVVPGGRPCKCGSKGCLEMYAAGPAIARNYLEAGGRSADAKEIADRARTGEALAQEIYQREGTMLGSVISKAVNILNPSKVVIGGGVAGAFDLFEPALRQTVLDEVYTSANPDVEILPTPLGYMAGLYSAAAIAVSRTDPGWSEKGGLKQ